MNSAKITEDFVRELLSTKSENKNIDFKESIKWNQGNKDSKLDTVKDVLAMSNTLDGGKIIVGVRDSDYELVGLINEDYESFDPTSFNDFLHNYTDPKFSCLIQKHLIDGKNIVVINVPEFEEEPIICKKDGHSSDQKKLILRRGAIYIRTDKATSETIPSSDEMRRLLGRAISKKGDDLLKSIESLIKGRPRNITEDVINKYKDEIALGKEFLTKNLRIDTEKKYSNNWTLCVYPFEYQKDRFKNQAEIKNSINESEVYLRGWRFPHTDTHGNTSNFLNGKQTHLKWGNHIEGYRAYLSGLFYWKKVFGEDVENFTVQGTPAFSYLNAIWLVTEIFVFIKRYYQHFPVDEDIVFRLTLNGIKGRQLVSRDPAIYLSDDYVSKEESVEIEETIQLIHLRSSWKEIAREVIKKIFMIFNWEDVNDKMLEDRQDKLIERRF